MKYCNCNISNNILETLRASSTADNYKRWIVICPCSRRICQWHLLNTLRGQISSWPPSCTLTAISHTNKHGFLILLINKLHTSKTIGFSICSWRIRIHILHQEMGFVQVTLHKNTYFYCDADHAKDVLQKYLTDRAHRYDWHTSVILEKVFTANHWTHTDKNWQQRKTVYLLQLNEVKHRNVQNVLWFSRLLYNTGPENKKGFCWLQMFSVFIVSSPQLIKHLGFDRTWALTRSYREQNVFILHLEHQHNDCLAQCTFTWDWLTDLDSMALFSTNTLWLHKACCSLKTWN